MNQPTVANRLNQITSVLKFEDAPAFGQGTLPADKERTFALLAHPFSLIIWLWKRGESPVVNAHGKEALNFAITLLICMFPLGFVMGFLPGIVATIIGLVLLVVNLGVLALVIYAALKARDGKLLRYPVNFRLIK